MRPVTLTAVLPLALAGALAIGGCGSGSSPTTSSAANAQAIKAAVAAARRAAEAKAPKGASPTLRALYVSFQKPKPNPQAKGSAAAIRAAERACAKKTPLEVKERFYAVAKRRLNSEQAKLIARIASFERHAATDVSFASGQLAADVYEATLPAAIGQYGYEGCIYSLARGLERQLAPKR